MGRRRRRGGNNGMMYAMIFLMLLFVVGVMVAMSYGGSQPKLSNNFVPCPNSGIKEGSVTVIANFNFTSF